MKKSALLIFVMIFVPVLLSGQIRLRDIKIDPKKILDVAKDEYVKHLEKSREEYDPSDFNYAVAFNDNSGLFENKEKLQRVEKGVLYVLSPESYRNQTAVQQARDLNDLGEIFYASGRYRSAWTSFTSAQVLYIGEGMENSPEAIQVMSNLGLLYHSSGRFSQAEKITLETMEKRKTYSGDLPGMGASYNNLAVLYKDMGKYTESEDYMDMAVRTIREAHGENSVQYAIALNNQAILFQTIGRYPEAEKLLVESIRIATGQLGEKSPNYVRLKVNLAMLYQLQGKFNEAETIFLDAIKIKQRRLGTNHPDYAVLLRNIAALYMQKGDFAKVEKNLLDAERIYASRLGKDAPQYAACVSELASYYLYMQKPDKAQPHIENALRIEKTALGEQHPSYVNSLERFAILQWMKKEIPDAIETYKKVIEQYLYQIDTYFPPMSEMEKSRFWSKINPKFVRFNSFAVEASAEYPEIVADMYDYHIATKALLLNSTSKVRRQILQSNDKNLIDKYNEWVDLKEYLSRLYTMSKDELKEDKINLDSLENQANRLERDLSRESELFAQGYTAKRVSYKDIASQLKEGEAALEFIRFRKFNYLSADTSIYYAALLIDNKTVIPKMVVFTDGNEMETTHAAAYKRAMERAFENNSFYEIYWRDLSGATAQYKKLFVSADGIYTQINLNTLQNEAGKFLIDDKEIVYIPNSRIIKDLKTTSLPKVKNAVMIGDPNYAMELDWTMITDMPLPELPGTRIEVEKIRKLLAGSGWNAKAYLGDDAIEEAVKNVKSPSVLHIATHGFFLENAGDPGEEKVFGIEPVKAAANPLLRSGLMLAGADNTIQQLGKGTRQDDNDGILNAFEAMLLELDNTDMVILSACETGLGEVVNGEGVYGLQRAFQIAGASAVVISLWQVSDEITQRLMESFYRNWIRTGNRTDAFQKANLEIKKNYPAPFYWGAFVMINN